MSSFALFLVQFSRAFLVSFGDSAVGILLCFSCCFFHSVVVLLSVHFFALVPFLFYIRFPLVVVLFFAVLLFVVLGCFFFLFLCSSFLSCFCLVHFKLFLAFLHVFFSCLGWHPRQTTIIFCILARAFSGAFLVVTASEDRIYRMYTHKYLHII